MKVYNFKIKAVNGTPFAYGTTALGLTGMLDAFLEMSPDKTLFGSYRSNRFHYAYLNGATIYYDTGHKVSRMFEQHYMSEFGEVEGCVWKSISCIAAKISLSLFFDLVLAARLRSRESQGHNTVSCHTSTMSFSTAMVVEVITCLANIIHQQRWRDNNEDLLEQRTWTNVKVYHHDRNHTDIVSWLVTYNLTGVATDNWSYHRFYKVLNGHSLYMDTRRALTHFMQGYIYYDPEDRHRMLWTTKIYQLSIARIAAIISSISTAPRCPKQEHTSSGCLGHITLVKPRMKASLFKMSGDVAFLLGWC